MKKQHLLSLGLIIFLFNSTVSQTGNVLLIIADDIGNDAFNGFSTGSIKANTPHLDSLAQSGVKFSNFWSYPVCTSTRSCMMSGKYGVKTGVLNVPGHLDTSNTSIFEMIDSVTNNSYNHAVVGKWHISDPASLSHPAETGVNYYNGIIGGGVGDYFNWPQAYNGNSTFNTDYITTVLTDTAIDWINRQDDKWFMWLAHVSPHSPFHIPPAGMYSQANTTPNFRKYLAMMEALDFEIGRLLDNIPADVKDSTTIIFIGDNGTPGNFIQDFQNYQGKGSVYQGGVNTPMIVSGYEVSRQNETDLAQVDVVDMYATVGELVGAQFEGGKYNSLSFAPLLSNSNAVSRDYSYAEIDKTTSYTKTIRLGCYKLIDSLNGADLLFNVCNDPIETSNLLLGVTTAFEDSIYLELQTELQTIAQRYSCRDHIRNGDEEGIDCGGTWCQACSTSSIGEELDMSFKLYPNPTKGTFYIESNRYVNAQMSIYSISGRLLLTKTLVVNNGANEVTIPSDQGGFFFVQLSDLNTGVSSNYRVLKLE